MSPRIIDMLFIGGMADGRREKMALDGDRVFVYKYPSIVAYFIDEDVAPVPAPNIPSETYTMRELYNGRTIIELMVLENIPDFLIMPMLLAGYRNPKREEKEDE
ncbi:MAG: hypothetical protein KAR06_08085 [Deltaproteobacteria bacterium]|nr:hypothetical protein [Deltaproteobacteria bacterium]